LKFINVFQPNLTFKNIYDVNQALFQKEISGTSNVVKQFEEELAPMFERTHAVCLSNGTAALIVAIQSLDLKQGDEVIVPSFTIISCLLALHKAGLKAKFCDVDKDTWNMSLENVKKVYSKNTKAVLMVHTYGLTAEAEEIESFCIEKNLILIEDASEAHGQYYNNRPCGSFGDVSTLSFYANKHITSGEGGAILINDNKKYKKIKQMINLDFNNLDRFKHENFYENYRISGIAASLGKSQIKNLKKTIESKIIQAQVYDSLLQNSLDKVQLHLKKTSTNRNHYWVYGVLINSNYDRDELIRFLFENNIESRPFFWPLHLQPSYLKLNPTKELDVPEVSEVLANQGLYLPMGNHLNKKKQQYVVSKLLEFLN
jgi:perosamine synthetase